MYLKADKFCYYSEDGRWLAALQNEDNSWSLLFTDIEKKMNQDNTSGSKQDCCLIIFVKDSTHRVRRKNYNLRTLLLKCTGRIIWQHVRIDGTVCCCFLWLEVFSAALYQVLSMFSIKTMTEGCVISFVQGNTFYFGVLISFTFPKDKKKAKILNEVP